jgi:hypothetical protein
MTRTAFGAALLCLGALLLSEPTQAAQAQRGFRAPAMPRTSIRPMPARRAMPRPAVPRAFRHGPKPNVHGHHKKPHHFRRHRLVHPHFFSLAVPGVPVRAFAAPIDDDVETTAATTIEPVVPGTGTIVGCEMEDVAVNGGKTITVIRC